MTWASMEGTNVTRPKDNIHRCWDVRNADIVFSEYDHGLGNAFHPKSKKHILVQCYPLEILRPSETGAHHEQLLSSKPIDWRCLLYLIVWGSTGCTSKVVGSSPINQAPRLCRAFGPLSKHQEVGRIWWPFLWRYIDHVLFMHMVFNNAYLYWTVCG